jgi:uncharacterized delta-60 repeat protein
MRQLAVRGVFLATMVLGCGGAPTRTFQTRVIAAKGGTVAAGGATLVIPAGALDQDTTITVTISSPRASLPDGETIRGSIFDFGPDGTTFNTPATLTLPAAGTPAANESAIISFLDPAADRWVDLRSAGTGTAVSAAVSHFTEYAQRLVALTPGLPVRTWFLNEIRGNGSRKYRGTAMQVFGTLNANVALGPAFNDQPIIVMGDDGLTSVRPSDDVATAQVYSSEGGGTFAVSAEAPSMVDLAPDSPIGSEAILWQDQTFRRSGTGGPAALTFTITNIVVEATDFNNAVNFSYSECPVTPCPPLITAKVALWVTASTDKKGKIYDAGGVAELNGDARGWDVSMERDFGRSPLWTEGLFDWTVDPAKTIARFEMNGPLAITLNVSDLLPDEVLTLEIAASARTVDRRTGKDKHSSAYAYLRDPLTINGTTLTTIGLEPTNDPFPPPAAVEPVPGCVPGGPSAGTLSLSAGAYHLAEWAEEAREVRVTRTGGSSGAVSAVVTTSGGTATPGADYTPVSSTVTFADGDSAPRVVYIALVHDVIAEPDETVHLTLSEPGGCATVGPQSTAVLTILDDDRPSPSGGSASIGGTVAGLVGTGLVLQNLGSDDLRPGNGPFAFTIPIAKGVPYNVTVASQPTNPTQVCTVANGSGTVADANITDVTVTCTTLDPGSGLDSSFGGGGKVTAGLPGGATAMALGADGSIVLVGSKTLARYTSGGSPAGSFGAAGAVALPLGAGQAVAIQPDGKIVVAGFIRVGTNDDFGVARFNADGSEDTGFGSGGLVSTDFDTRADKVWAVLIQGDGKIVVAGHAATSATSGSDNDFAVVRYTSAGALDGTFGSGGKVTTNVGGRTDLVSAAALQPDGRIVVTGRVSDDGAGGDVGLVRYTTNGSPDASFGNQGIARSALASLPSDVALQSDGKMLVSVRAVVGGTTVFGAMRFDGSGNPDGGFGSGGLATAGFSMTNDYAHRLAVQPDGRILVVGESSNLMNSNFAIARFTTGGTLDSSFGNDGKLTLDFFGAPDAAACAALQADGKIVVGGVAVNGTSIGLGLARLLP